MHSVILAVHFINFSYIHFWAKMSCPPKLTELLCLWSNLHVSSTKGTNGTNAQSNYAVIWVSSCISADPINCPVDPNNSCPVCPVIDWPCQFCPWWVSSNTRPFCVGHICLAVVCKHDVIRKTGSTNRIVMPTEEASRSHRQRTSKISWCLDVWFLR